MTFFLAEDAAIIAALDPEGRGIDWLVFDAEPLVRAIPGAPKAAETSRTAKRRKLK